MYTIEIKYRDVEDKITGFRTLADAAEHLAFHKRRADADTITWRLVGPFGICDGDNQKKTAHTFSTRGPSRKY